MNIQLTTQQIDMAMPKIAKGLQQYLWLQNKVTSGSPFHDAEFRKKFNHFYRVRRGSAWQDTYYELMELAKKNQLQFSEAIDLLYRTTNRYEASFASKLIATLNPISPIIDSVVLKNLGLRLPYPYETNRAEKITKLHHDIQSCYASFLKTEIGKYLIGKFKFEFSNVTITNEKMLDFVLWQIRR